MTNDKIVETLENDPEAETLETEVPTVESTLSKKFDKVDEIATNSLDAPKIVEGQNGQIAYGTDKGVNYKPHNEDAIVINTGVNALAVIDGIGGEEMGEKAAQILAEEIQKGLNSGIDAQTIQRNAHLRMDKEGVGQGGACYILAKIDGRKLTIFQAGDVKLIVLDKQGNIKFETKDEDRSDIGRSNQVTNYVGGEEQGETTHSETSLENGNRVICASDGLWDNLKPEDVANLIKDQPIDVAIYQINNLAKAAMKTSGGKPDNIGVVIADFDYVKRT